MKNCGIWYQPAQTVRRTERERRGLSARSGCSYNHSLVHLEGAGTTMDAWNALQSAYEDKGVNRRCILLGKLFDVKLKDFNNMENYVTQVLKTA
jgi:hypothetical protein